MDTLLCLFLLFCVNYYIFAIDAIHLDILRCSKEMYYFYTRSRNIPYLTNRMKKYRMAIIVFNTAMIMNYLLICELL